MPPIGIYRDNGRFQSQQLLLKRGISCFDINQWRFLIKRQDLIGGYRMPSFTQPFPLPSKQVSQSPSIVQGNNRNNNSNNKIASDCTAIIWKRKKLEVKFLCSKSWSFEIKISFIY